MSKKDLLRVQQQYANPSTLNKQQVEEFRQRVLVEHGKRDHAIVTLLAYASLRISECLNLKPEDINLAAMEVRIQKGKGDKERIVYLNDKIANAVREYLAERPTGCPYLFVSRKGGRLDRSAVNRIFNQCSDTITPYPAPLLLFRRDRGGRLFDGGGRKSGRAQQHPYDHAVYKPHQGGNEKKGKQVVRGSYDEKTSLEESQLCMSGC